MTDKARPVFECQRCGRCCLHFSALSACLEDIERWQIEGREDILQYADMFIYTVLGEADLWIDPETGEELSRCPFLRKVRNKQIYRCRIYDTRPKLCQEFPHLAYDENNVLVGLHSWTLENCPGVKALLKDWTPQQVQALRELLERKRITAAEQQVTARPGPTRKSRESLLHTCAWCKGKLPDGSKVHALGLATGQKATLEGKEGQFIPLFLDLAQDIVYAFVATSDSEARKKGWDYMFMTCSPECSARLGAALQQEIDAMGKTFD